MRGICEGVEHHLWSSDFRPADRVIRTLLSSKLILQCTAVRAEGGGLLTEEGEVKARWAGYFERLYQSDPPAVELDVRGVTIPPINCDPALFVETGCGELGEMGVKLLGSRASTLNFSKLVEMLNSCHCMQFRALLEHRHHPN